MLQFRKDMMRAAVLVLYPESSKRNSLQNRRKSSVTIGENVYEKRMTRDPCMGSFLAEKNKLTG